VGLAVSRLVEPGRIGWPRLVQAMSTRPAEILGLNRGTLRPGAVADITLIDPDLAWRVDAKAFLSKSGNSPFHGWTLQGRAVATIVGGRVKYRLREPALA
jgi:dihydroorotase